jgi:hypothetical protein
MGAYSLYVPMDATRKTDSKTSKIGTFIPSDSLSPGGRTGCPGRMPQNHDKVI